MVAEGLIHGPIQRGECRYEQDQAARRRQQPPHRLERSDVVVHVLEDVETDDRIEPLPSERAELVRQIEASHRDIGMLGEARAQPVQVLLPRIGEHQPFAVHQKLRQVADSGSDLQHPAAHPAAQAIEHPAVVALCAGELLQRLRADRISRRMLDCYGVPLVSESGFLSLPS